MSIKNRDISSAFLKHLALVLMIFNHAAYVYFAQVKHYYGFWYDFQWYVTRGSFVIYAFQLAEGMYQTHDRKKYLLRLLLLAFISEVPFDLCFNQALIDLSDFNVFFTLFLGGYCIMRIDETDNKVLKVFTAILVMFFAWLLQSDYNAMGVALILCFYYLKNNKTVMYLMAAFILFGGYFVIEIQYLLLDFDLFFDPILEGALQELHGALVFPLLMMYQGRKGKMLNKWFYYFAYPVHLLLIFLICQIL